LLLAQSRADFARLGAARHYVPVPTRLTLCGLTPPSSPMVTHAFRNPVAAGEKVTVIVQLALAAMLVPQVFVSEKSHWLIPVTLIPIKFNCVLPVLVSVTPCGGLFVPTA
jgi:hypothetical protein